MSQQKPRSSFLQTMLIAAVVYMGFLLFFPNKGGAKTGEAFFAAQKEYDAAKKAFDGFVDPAGLKQAQQALTDAQGVLAKATTPEQKLAAQKQVSDAQKALDNLGSVKQKEAKSRLETATTTLVTATPAYSRELRDKKGTETEGRQLDLKAADLSLQMGKDLGQSQAILGGPAGCGQSHPGAYSLYKAVASEAPNTDEGLAGQRGEVAALLAGLDIAKNNHDLSIALAVYNDFHELARRVPQTDATKQAAQLEVQATEVGRDIARNHNNGPTSIGYHIIDGLVNLLGGERAPGFSYWAAALLMALAVRGLIWPLAKKQMIGFKRMALLQPMIKELQGKYQGPELQQRTMKMYQKYGINPLAGCWPMLIQMPIFLWVFYSMRTYQFEFHKGTFLWVSQGMAAKYPGIIAPNLGEKDVPLVILYGISMVATSLLSVNDPSTAKQARITGVAIGILFTVMMLFWSFPSAFIIYWIGLNVLATIQSVLISRSPIPPLVERPDHELPKKGGMFSGLVPSNGPAGNGAPKAETKTGAPVVHKPKKRKKK